MVESFRTASLLVWRDGGFTRMERAAPAESAVAISVNGSTHAVMMATPADLREFAFGLALNERIISRIEDVESLDIEPVEGGYDCRLWLAPELATRYVARRRLMTGPVGCGLCGAESLEQAHPELVPLPDRLRIEPASIVRAMAQMSAGQVLGARTRAVHAAAFANVNGEVQVVREDVGRHNALDKVAGWLALEGRRADDGFLVMTSRVSVELIQKAVTMRCELLAAVSAPTELALQSAAQAGLTLVVVVRGETFEIATRPERIAGAPSL